MTIEKKIIFTDVDPSLLLGANDMYLQQIEEQFPVSEFVARGNTLLIRGEDTDVMMIEKILQEIKTVLLKNGELKSQDVDYILRSSLFNQNKNTEIDTLTDVILANKGNLVRAKTNGQKKILKSSQTCDIVFAIGPAGTGKTYTSVAIAVAALKEKKIQRLVLARPAVEAGESLGFLPGELSQKVEPYLRPLYDAIEDMLPPEKLKNYIEQKIIEIVPLAYMRGRTFNHSFILLDEAQNTTTLQMKMFLTRLGIQSKAIVMGDITQIDLPPSQRSGLVDVQHLLQGISGIDFVTLDKSDVVRHRLVREIIEAYEKQGQSNHKSTSR